MRTPSDVLKLAKAKGAKMVDFKFVDIPGIMQHFSSTISEFEAKTFEEGVGFDGSSIRGFQGIEESDMLLMPDPKTAIIDPFMEIPTLSLLCDVAEPGKKKRRYSRDPRYVAQKAEEYLKKSGIGDISYWGPECEFFIFDHVQYNCDQNGCGYRVDSSEAIWNTNGSESPNLGYKIRNKEGSFPVPPSDSLQDIRSEMCLTMIDMGIALEKQHHEVATAGQAEIDLRFDSLTNMADKVMLYKYATKNVAKKHGKTVTFMPKPIFGDNGSGMHVHQSVWKNGKNMFYDAKGYAELSDLAMHYIGGLLEHASALLAFTSPTTNSYKRLVPGYEAPVNLAYSQRNRSAAIRIPVYDFGPAYAKRKRIEFRPPDNSCNPYLAFAAMLMAGIDGVKNKTNPGKPLDKNTYHLSPEDRAKVKSVPGSLNETLEALEDDREFLTAGGVFTDDLINTWIDYKRNAEIDPVRIRPHPYELYLYYDI